VTSGLATRGARLLQMLGLVALAAGVAATGTAAPAASQRTIQMPPTPGIVTRDTELKAEPFLDARTLATLRAKSAVTIVDRRGGWLNVVSGNARGWLRMLHVSSRPAAGGTPSARELEAAARVATGRAGTGNIAVTTGIRGLTPEQLRHAQPNPAELEQLQKQGVEPPQAAAYAAANGLERRQVAYPPEPKRAPR
jgi:hypothetical protein